MKRMLKVLILVLLCAASYTACQRASEEKHAERQEAADTVQRNFQALSDSMQVAWQVLITEEEQKRADLRRLLEEISYAPAHTINQDRLDTLQNQLANLFELELDPLTMSSEEIDHYDSVSAQVQHNIISFARDQPNIEEYPLIEQLIESITDADRRVLFLRVEYDNHARDYLHFIEGHREFIRTVDTSGLHQRRPLFQLPETEADE